MVIGDFKHNIPLQKKLWRIKCLWDYPVLADMKNIFSTQCALGKCSFEMRQILPNPLSFLSGYNLLCMSPFLPLRHVVYTVQSTHVGRRVGSSGWLTTQNSATKWNRGQSDSTVGKGYDAYLAHGQLEFDPCFPVGSPEPCREWSSSAEHYTFEMPSSVKLFCIECVPSWDMQLWINATWCISLNRA